MSGLIDGPEKFERFELKENLKIEKLVSYKTGTDYRVDVFIKSARQQM